VSGPRVLLSTAPFHHRPLPDAFAVAAEAGFDGVELMVTGDPATQDAAGVAALAAAHGLPVPVVHGPFLLLTRRALGVDPLEKAARTLVMARSLGADLVIVHPPFRWQGAFRSWLDERADDDAAAHGTRVAVENLYPLPLGPATPRLHTATHPEHLSGHRHVVLDTSHLAVTGVDLGAAWDVVGDRVAHLHVSDHDGGWGDRHLPIGAGTLPLGPLLGRVGRDVVAPSVTLELHLRRETLADRAGLVRLLRVQRERCLALLAARTVPRTASPAAAAA
jgi:sugar phosphate isomerase/epimerase